MNENNEEECQKQSIQQMLHFPTTYKEHDNRDSISFDIMNPNFQQDLFETNRQNFFFNDCRIRKDKPGKFSTDN